MAIETEIKYRLTKDQFAELQEILKEIGAEFIAEDFEENIIYGGAQLDPSSSVLRIRKITGRTFLTFKKRIPSQGGIKNQIEHETIVENAEELEKIIGHAGFEKRLVYEKRRQRWHFRKVEIVLDELPFGLFMEIEGAFMAIKEAEMFLGAEEFETEFSTYPRLTAELGSHNGQFIEARF